jgi:CheY-like chemotaxis protein
MSTGLVAVVALAILGVVALVMWAIFAIGSHSQSPPQSVESPPGSKTDAELADSGTRSERTVCSQSNGPNAIEWPQESGNEQSADSSASDRAAARDKMILVADDDPVVLRVLSQRLEHLGYRVHCAVDASQALLDVPKVRPDLAILDLVMPAGNGLIVCEMLGCDREYADIPIIVHSVFTDESIKRRTRQLKAHYVEKSPHSWSEIQRLVEMLLEGKPSPASTESEEKARQSAVANASEKPAASSEATALPNGSQAASDTVSARQQRPLTVLCIDDDPVVRHSVTSRLKPYGIKVAGVEGGLQGYDSAVADRPDVILLDLKMPDQQGDRVMAKLKENPQTRNIPVIVLTMESTAGVRRRMTSLGAESLVSKPIHWPELFLCMGRCVELPQQLIHDYGLSDSLARAPAASV